MPVAANIPSRVFADDKLNDHFLKYGYVVTDFLNAAEVEKLATYYINNPLPAAAGFHTTHFAANKDYKQKVHDVIVATLKHQTDKLLLNYKAAFGNYMIKEAGGGNPMPLHADWAYVDESQYTSIAIWIPLTDTTVDNGCLGVIPFSQHLSHNIRGPRILQWEYPHNETLINGIGRLLPMRAGQAVIYNHRTLHYSPPNNSANIRLALNLSLVPANAPVIHYTIPEGRDKIHKFAVEDFSFFIHYDNFQMPERGKVVEQLPVTAAPLLNDKVNSFLETYVQTGFIARLKSAFNFLNPTS